MPSPKWKTRYDDDDVIEMVIESGGEIVWNKHDRSMPPEGQLKRLVKQGRLYGATMTVSPWQGSCEGGVYVKVGIPDASH